MSFFQDALSIFKKRELVFLESFKESGDVYTFLFEKEQDLTWKAGQHGLFSITHKKVKSPTKPFTLASAPAENKVQITMKVSENPSEFKKAMLELKEGMKVSMSGPVGGFYLKEQSPSLLIAGGIGITPFRSIIKQIEADGHKLEKPVHLLYMDSNQSYIFKAELDGMATHPLINVTYVDSRESLHQEIDKFAASHKNDGKYFIAGPKSMVDSISTKLQDHHIAKRNIKKDAFFGY
ncbi:ferredoxin-NADP reductase [Cytobacillus eiseniae]|uniref:Ferredoxin-NADP reductase n=1 Tax=Cytobacillus eiseniae TaxID=762947 RepID=A0ABS4RF74_9BACI|nr:FAD-dependent oxidoreductase [Cytobacillus eiseniae]MBP2241558.1 ferredoxin-NADP reductase [Cytobacillus eiseniae]